MAKIHSLTIKNFRGIKEFHQEFRDKKFVCLIGRGDSGKSTILDAISYVLSPSWTIPFYDTDFYKCNTGEPIQIEATVTGLDEYFLSESKTGLYIRGIDKDGKIVDDFEESEGVPALTIRLLVQDDLEPRWYIVPHKDAEELLEVKAAARARFNANLINDYADRHFSWNKGNPLYSILKQQEAEKQDNENIVVNALREAKQKIDNNGFKELESAIENVVAKAAEFGVDIKETTSTLDFKDIALKDSKVVLHDENKIPFRLKGKGLKRLISIAIQLTQSQDSGIILIDEVEQGLEPDRAQHLVSQLKKNNSQVFITTHSRDVAVELDAADIMIMRKGKEELMQVPDDIQDCIRKNPEALMAKKIVICEGATEVGICKGINEYRVTQGKKNSSYNGVRFADGSGTNLVKYAKGFKTLGYDIVVFCDSDDTGVNSHKQSLIDLGINILDCENDYAIENQIFNDIPWAAVVQMVNYRIDEKAILSIKQDFTNNNLGDFPDDWENCETSLRIKLSKACAYKKDKGNGKFEDKSWFKRIDHGIFLGSTICRYISEIEDTRLGKNIQNLIKWMDND